MNENIRVFDAFYNGFRAFRENLKALNPFFVKLSVRGAGSQSFRAEIQSQSRSRGAGKSVLSCRKHQKGQTESPGIREKVGLNRAEESGRADRIAGKPGKSRPKSCRSSRKGRQNRLESGRK